MGFLISEHGQTFMHSIELCHLQEKTVTNYSSTLQVICDVGKLDGTLSKKTCVSFQGDVCLSWNRKMLIWPSLTAFIASQYCCHMFDPSCVPGNQPP